MSLTIPEMGHCKHYSWEIPATAAGPYCKLSSSQGRASCLTVLQCFCLQGQRPDFLRKLQQGQLWFSGSSINYIHAYNLHSTLKVKGILSLKCIISAGPLPSKCQMLFFCISTASKGVAEIQGPVLCPAG